MNNTRIIIKFISPILILLGLLLFVLGVNLESLLASIAMSIVVVVAMHLTLGRYSDWLMDRTRNGPLFFLESYQIRVFVFVAIGVFFPLFILTLWPTDFDPLLAFTTAVTVVFLQGAIHFKTPKNSQANEFDIMHLETYKILARNPEPYHVSKLTIILQKERDEFTGGGSDDYLRENARETVERHLKILEQNGIVGSKYIMNRRIYYLKQE